MRIEYLAETVIKICIYVLLIYVFLIDFNRKKIGGEKKEIRSFYSCKFFIFVLICSYKFIAKTR